jgi:hypothetical protein
MDVDDLMGGSEWEPFIYWYQALGQFPTVLIAFNF